MRIARAMELSHEQSKTLLRLSRGQKVSVRLARRARIVLLASAGAQNLSIAAQLGISRYNVARWRDRFVRLGLSKPEKVKAGQGRHPRFHFPFTPTSASWLNMVERFLRDVSENWIKRGVFYPVADLEAASTQYLTIHNKSPKPFIWTAKAADILQKVVRGRKALHKLQSV